MNRTDGAAEVPLRWRLGGLAAVLAFHLPALKAGFSNDDFGFYSFNASLRHLDAIPGYFATSFPPGDAERGLYRPLTNTVYALEWALFGDSPTGPHAVQLLGYAGVLVAAWALLRRWLGSARVAFAAALLFGVHPVHTEVVDSVAGLSELLGLGLSLVSLNLLDRAVTGRPAAGPWAGLAFVLATFAKESSVVLPGVGLLLVALRAPGGLPDRLRRGAAICAPGFVWVGVYFLIRRAALGQLTPTQTILGDATPLGWFATVGAVMAEYTRLLVAPGILAVDGWYRLVHPGVLEAPTAASFAGWVVVLAAGFGFGAAALRALRGEPGPIGAITLGLGMAAAWLFPVSHVIPFGALLAERFLFAPSFGLSLAAAAAWERAAARRPALGGSGARVGFALLLLAFGARSTLRAREWESTRTLWAPILAMRPDDPKLLNNVAMGYLESGDVDGALPYLTRAIALDPTLAKAVQNRGWIRLQAGDLVGAEADYRRAAALEPDNPVILNGLGQVCNRTLRHVEAARLYERALALNPNDPDARDNLAATRVALERARAWLDAHPEARGPDASPADRETLRQACTVVDDQACLAALGAP